MVFRQLEYLDVTLSILEDDDTGEVANPFLVRILFYSVFIPRLIFPFDN